MALPPSVFVAASICLKQECYSETAQNRLVVEKPFGKDSSSSNELAEALAQHWTESEIYRIDHYLGKEMVKSLMVIRFAIVYVYLNPIHLIRFMKTYTSCTNIIYQTKYIPTPKDLQTLCLDQFGIKSTLITFK